MTPSGRTNIIVAMPEIQPTTDTSRQPLSAGSEDASPSNHQLSNHQLSNHQLSNDRLGDGSLDGLSDPDLLGAWCVDGQPAAMAALVRRYSAMVLSVCRRRCNRPSDVDDAFQTTFLYLAGHADKIKQPDRLAGWLHRVAQRSAIAVAKSSKLETEPMIDPVAEEQESLDRLTRRHEAIALDEEIANLPDHYRSAIVMHYFQDCQLSVLAEHFGTTVGTIRGRLQRGKHLLSKRLRRRGIAPALAFAAANTLAATDLEAAEIAMPLIESIHCGDLPDPPIETTLLHSYLAQGNRSMSSLYLPAGLLAGSAVVAAVLFSGGSHAQSGGSADPASARQISIPGAPADQLVEPGTSQFGTVNSSRSPQPSVKATPTSQVADRWLANLNGNVELNVQTTLEQLPKALSQATKMPVFLDARGMQAAQVDSKTAQISYHQNEMPLKSALRSMLQPLGLKAKVEDEGLVITADPSELVHRGIGTSRWVSINNDAAKEIEKELATTTSFNFVKLPLSDAVAQMSERHGIAIVIDKRALDEIGISPEDPVDLRLQGVQLKSVMQLMLNDLDLTTTVQGETLVVTSKDSCENDLLTRIYWLEGTGFEYTDSPSSYQPLADAIRYTVEPSTWDGAGGSSTLTPVTTKRPAIMVSTTFRVHQQIESLIDVLREPYAKAIATNDSSKSNRKSKKPTASPASNAKSNFESGSSSGPAQPGFDKDPFGGDSFGDDPFGN